MERFRVAVIGRTGRGDYGHGLDVAWLDMPEAEIVAVADDDPVGLAAAAKRLKTDRAFADYRRMLDEMQPEVVSVAPRWLDCHYEMALECLNRGIHVFLEKPFCRTLAEADELVAACERTHTKLAIAHQTRYSPRLPLVKQLIADGRIGRVLEYRGRAKEDQRSGGEELWVHGTHLFDLVRSLSDQNALWCFGHVTQDGRPIAKSDVVDGPEGIGLLAGDDLHAVYGMADGSMTYFSAVRNVGSRLSRFGLQIFGTAGVIEIVTGHLQPTVKYLADPSWSPARSGAKWVEVSTAGIGKPEPLPDRLPNTGNQHAGNQLLLRDLLTAIKENRQPLDNVYEARAATEMIVAVFESQRLGRPVTLPLTTRQNPLSLLR